LDIGGLEEEGNDGGQIGAEKEKEMV